MVDFSSKAKVNKPNNQKDVVYIFAILNVWFIMFRG